MTTREEGEKVMFNTKKKRRCQVESKNAEGRRGQTGKG
jgi:hypothetical protein